MSRVLSASVSAPVLEASIRRWLPPDVGFEPEVVVEEPPEPPPPPPPTAEEIAAIEEAARAAGHERGHREGYHEGYEAGYREGREKADQEAAAERAEREAREHEWRQTEERTLRETVASLENIARAFADPLADSADALEPELLVLISALARQVVMAELTIRPELIQQVLRVALEQLPSRKHSTRVHVNPRDQTLLTTWAESNDEQLIWVADPELEPGGCLVISGPSRIDASLETRLRQGIEAIWGELDPPAPATEAPVSAAEPSASADTASNQAGASDVVEPESESKPEPEPELVAEIEPETESRPVPARDPEPESEPSPGAELLADGADRVDPAYQEARS